MKAIWCEGSSKSLPWSRHIAATSRSLGAWSRVATNTIGRYVDMRYDRWVSRKPHNRCTSGCRISHIHDFCTVCSIITRIIVLLMQHAVKLVCQRPGTSTITFSAAACCYQCDNVIALGSQRSLPSRNLGCTSGSFRQSRQAFSFTN